MLLSAKGLRGYDIRAIDGVIGTVDDLYVDDESWSIRYLVVRTGNWLSGRKVLISPTAVGHAGWMARQLPVALTRAQVERSPDSDTIIPVSWQHQSTEFGLGNPQYWGGAGLWGLGAYPGSLTTAGRVEEQLKAQRTDPPSTPVDGHLRSTNAILGHDLQATDGGIGHVEDLLVDNHTWVMTELIVATGNWWDGRRVLVSARTVKNVSWPEATVAVALTRQAVKDSPRYDSLAQLERQQAGMPHERLARSAHVKEEECRGGHR